MLLQNDGDRFGFGATQGEMIIANANLNRITQRCALYYADSGTGDNTHFHQANSLRIRPFN